MKPVVLSADSELSVYLVPDFIAEAFTSYCMDFSMNFQKLMIHPRVGGGHAGFDERALIAYLNMCICKEEKCMFVERLGWEYNNKKWPIKYRKVSRFNF